MTIQEAYKLCKQTDYAHDAVIMEGECDCGRKVYNSINWADASAFFLEGYQYALKSLGKITSPPAQQGCDSLPHIAPITTKLQVTEGRGK